MRKLWLLLLLLLSTFAYADTIFVEEPGGALPPGLDASNLKELIRTSATSQGHSVVNDSAAAQYSLRASVIRLGNSYILTVDKFVQGKLDYSSRMKARELEELDEVAGRVVRSVTSGRDPKADARPS